MFAVQVAKRARNEVEEKKRETSPKPLNVNAQNIWGCGDPGLKASRPRRDEIRKARGMARRIKEKQHWVGMCAGMAMALVYIDPIEVKPPPRVYPGVTLSLGAPDSQLGPPLGGQGGLEGGGSQSQGTQEKDQQRKKERDRPLSEEHKNKRRKLKQLELGQMTWGARDKDG